MLIFFLRLQRVLRGLVIRSSSEGGMPADKEKDEYIAGMDGQ